jgi:O-antigen ligase
VFIVVTGTFCVGIIWFRFLFLSIRIQDIGEFWGSGNQIGLLLFIGAFFCATNCLRYRSPKNVFLFLVLTSGLILLTARASWLALFISLFSFIWFRIRVIGVLATLGKMVFPAFSFILIAGVVVFAGLAGFLTGLDDAGDRIVYYLNKGLSQRDVIWLVSLEQLSRNPFLGSGWSYSLELEGSFAGKELSSHNTFLHIALCGGVLGLMFFLLFLLVTYVKLARKRKSNTSSECTMYDEMSSIFLGLLVVMMFESVTLGGFALRNILFTALLACIVGRAAVRTRPFGTGYV